MNNYNNIEELLRKYWECDTSTDDEKILQDFFLYGENIPAHLRRYKSLFAYQKMKQAEKLSGDFDTKILTQIKPKLKIPPILYKIAASIILFSGISIKAYQYKTTSDSEKQAQARETVINALCIISDNLQKGESMINKGLEQFDIISEINY